MLRLLLPLILLATASCVSGSSSSTGDSSSYNVAKAASVSDTTAESRPDLKSYFDAVGAADGAFVIFDAGARHYVRYNPERSAERFLPASTFKIFNSLVSLESGVVKDEHEVLRWDGVVRSIKEWNRDLDMADAFRLSAVWFYQEMARRVGESRMRSWVEREHYGNMDIGGGIDHFWLDGRLRISADEQIGLLRRLHERKLDFSERSMGIVERIMVIDSAAGYTLRGKTGWASGSFGELGWLVGWVERGGRVYYFAMNIASADPKFPMIAARRQVLYGILRELGVLPADAR